MTRFTFLLLLFISGWAWCNTGDYVDNPELIALIDEVALSGKYSKDELVTLFSDVKHKSKIIEAISRTAEGTLTWGEYQKIFLDGKRNVQGIEFWEKYEDTLNKAEEEFGVPAEIIVAIIGVETRYGRNKGNYRVLDSLSTLAFDYPPRSKFFRGELRHFLYLSKEAHIDPATAKGSYAGAMGFPQFISSSYRSYAVDFDKDGVTDLLNNPVDAIGSVANYFKKHGWKTGKPVAARANITNQKYDDIISESLKPKLTLKTIADSGLKPISCTVEPAPTYCLDADSNSLATAMKLQGENGAEFWIGLKNFYVITRYNHSKLYAMAAFQLSRDIKQLKEATSIASQNL